MRRLAITATLVVSGLIAAWGALALLEGLSREDVRTARAITLPADGRLRVETGSGDVRVEATDGPPQVVFEGQKGLFGGGGLRTGQGDDGRVRLLRTDCSGFGLLDSCGGSLQVLIPAGSALEIDTGSGAIGVRGIRGGVVAETGSGDVRLDDVGGAAIRIDTGSGEIGGGGVATRSLKAETGSGDVALDVTTPPDDVTVETGSGEVRLTVPDEVYDVGSETGSGESKVTVRSATGSPRRLRVKTGSGDVRVAPRPLT